MSPSLYGTIGQTDSAGAVEDRRVGLFAPGSLSPDEMRAICATAFMRVPDHRQRAILEARPIYEQIDMHLAMARCGAPE